MHLISLHDPPDGGRPTLHVQGSMEAFVAISLKNQRKLIGGLLADRRVGTSGTETEESMGT